MKKFVNWLLNHMVIAVAIVTFTVTLAVIGGVMLHSHLSYKAYEKDFNQTDLEIRSVSPAQPNFIEMQDGFKSTYKKKLVIGAEDLKVTSSQTEFINEDYIDLTEKGGTISITLVLEEKSFLDIDFEVATEYVNENPGDDEEPFGIKDLLSNAQFIVNGETMEEEINLVDEGFHHLVMAGFALPEGQVEVQIKSVSGKEKQMPLLRSIKFYSSAQLSFPEEAEE